MTVKTRFTDLVTKLGAQELGLYAPASDQDFKFLDDLGEDYDTTPLRQLYEMANGQSNNRCPIFGIHHFHSLSQIEEFRHIQLMMASNDLEEKLQQGRSHGDMLDGIEHFNCALFWDPGWVGIASGEYSPAQIILDIDRRRPSFGMIGAREMEDTLKGYRIADSMLQFIELTIELVGTHELTSNGSMFEYHPAK